MQFPKPLLPVVTRETIDAHVAASRGKAVVMEEIATLRRENPLLAKMTLLSTTDSEIHAMSEIDMQRLVTTLLIYGLLRAQAAADQEAACTPR